MSVKRTLTPHLLVTAQSLGASVNFTPSNINLTDNVGYQINITSSSSLNGVFTVQVSADYEQDFQGNVLRSGNWATVKYADGTTVQASVSANGTVYFDLNQLSAPWARLVYTRTGGSASADVYVTGKTMGG